MPFIFKGLKGKRIFPRITAHSHHWCHQGLV
uniref:Uncharacterized protein n=1 Tax=Arundo donax TaxID=35708 RepID=A0A0A9QGW0_ARUDO